MVGGQSLGRSTACQVAECRLPHELVLHENAQWLQVYPGGLYDIVWHSAMCEVGCSDWESACPQGFSAVQVAFDD